jgi:hypothetical protein
MDYYVDYQQRIAELVTAEAICEKHVISAPINGVQSSYPRWNEVWKSCEEIHRAWLDEESIKSQKDMNDRVAIINEARKLRGTRFGP